MRPALVLAACLCAGSGLAETCDENRVTVAGDWGRAGFNVIVADDPAEQAQGLMNVPQMPLMAGMLFVYPAPHRVSFWMKNTLIPLDMLFVGPDGQILSIHENAVPLDETSIPGGEGVQFVLEINGGMATRLGIEVGDVMQHPRFGPQAILPCAE